MSATATSVKNQVESVLSSCSDFRTNVHCVPTEEGEVVLRGSVSTYFLKQRAQEMIRKLDCVVKILNELDVG